jgi:hypothetical protein
MRCVAILLGIAFLLGVFAPAEASIITIDANDFAPGADISNPVPGVTFTSYPGNGFPEVYAVPSAVDEDNLVFGHQVDAAGSKTAAWGGKATHWYFEAEFDTPTDFVSLDFIVNDTDGGTDLNPYLIAYSGRGTPALVSVTGYEPQKKDWGWTLTVSDPQQRINRIVASWDIKGFCDNGELDRMQYNTHAPEPSSIAIWSLLAVACGIVSYRRKR